MRRSLGLALLPLLAASPGPAAGDDGPAEKPGAVVFLRDAGRGEPAPSKEGLADLVVLSEVPEGDPWYAAVGALGRRDVKEVVPFRAGRLEEAFRRLQALRPGFVVVLVRPGTLDVNFHFEFLERASRLDGDPFVDFAFGYLTGATPEEAVAFAAGIAAARGREVPRTILSFGPSSSPAPLTPEAPHKWASGFRTRSLLHPEGDPGVADLLKGVKAVGVYAASGHGFPDRVADGLTGAQVRASGLDLHPALYFSGPCYCGVTGRWFSWEKGALAEKTVAPRESFLLALLRARAAGVFAGLDPDRGETAEHELEQLLLTGGPLGGASKATYDDVVVAYRRDRLVLPRYAPGKGRPHRDIHDQMISGSACRALFGDPAWAPFPASGVDPFRVTTERTKEGLTVLWRGDGSLGGFWSPVDVNRAEGRWSHRLKFRLDLPREEAASLKRFEVLSVTRDGKPLDYRYPTAAIESWGDRVRVHGFLSFPPDGKDRALWGGKAWEARFRFR